MWRRCGKPNCACAQPGRRGHGPQWNLTRRVGGKTVNVHLKTGPELEKAQREVAEHQRFADLVEEVTAGPAAGCPAGHRAAYAGSRDKTVTTVLGQVRITRAWYHCAGCHHGFAPRDQRLGVAGSSLSPGLAEMTALAGAFTRADTRASFAADGAEAIRRAAQVPLGRLPSFLNERRTFRAGPRPDDRGAHGRPPPPRRL